MKYCDGPMSVGKRLKSARERAGLSQRQLGAAAQVTGAYVSRAEVGDRNVSLQVLNTFAEVLGLPAKYLTWGWRPPFSTKERAVWILEIFGDATDEELKQIKLYNPPKMLYERLPWLVQKLLTRGRPVLATNAKKVYDLRFKGGRR